MKTNKFNLILSITLVIFAGGYLPFLPAQIPIHMNYAGKIDAYGPSWTLILFAAIPLLFLLSLNIKGLYRNYNYDTANGETILSIVFYLLVYLVVLMFLFVSVKEFAIDNGIRAGFGVFLIFLGNFLPRFKYSNYSNKTKIPAEDFRQVIRKTNRVAGYLSIVFGVVVISTCMLKSPFFIVLFFASILFVPLLTYLYYVKLTKTYNT